MTASWIALGGNVGDVAQTFERSLSALDQMPGIAVVKRSRNYSTSPVGTNSGDRFINSAAHLDVRCTPLELLDSLQTVETQMGRIRQLRWGPRTLDLDLLFYDQHVVATPRLTIPHPHLWFRRFVLDPLAEIAPDLIHPQHGISVSGLRNQLLIRPLPCVLVGGDSDEREALQQEMAAQFPETTWQTSATPETRLAFSLEQAPGRVQPSMPAARVIMLKDFPTALDESLRDVLHAALDPATPID